ncbi:HD domain-containing protein, partial [Pedobacter suwonensis]|uniref:HD domain-containing protein n=2 Tax=Pedobacter suwonensis TaxID=332999 RepID=UPI003803AD92
TIVLDLGCNMNITEEILLTRVERFVEDRLKNRLSTKMYFHNLEHTLLVVEGVELIGRAVSLNNNECFLLILAAFLHDVGYTEKYIGHEEESANIAAEFLGENGLEPEKIEVVKECIKATKFPQQPENELQMVICDADFYHFALRDYQDYADRLRAEWETNLNLFYTNLEWDTLNFNMLSAHEYFTSYGKEVLQEKKKFNLERLKSRIS